MSDWWVLGRCSSSSATHISSVTRNVPMANSCRYAIVRFQTEDERDLNDIKRGRRIMLVP